MPNDQREDQRAGNGEQGKLQDEAPAGTLRSAERAVPERLHPKKRGDHEQDRDDDERRGPSAENPVREKESRQAGPAQEGEADPRKLDRARSLAFLLQI